MLNSIIIWQDHVVFPIDKKLGETTSFSTTDIDSDVFETHLVDAFQKRQRQYLFLIS